MRALEKLLRRARGRREGGGRLRSSRFALEEDATTSTTSAARGWSKTSSTPERCLFACFTTTAKTGETNAERYNNANATEEKDALNENAIASEWDENAPSMNTNENPNENKWRRMLREADEFVLPQALRLKTVTQSGGPDGKRASSSFISNVPAKAIVRETNRLMNRKGVGFYNDIKSEYNIKNNNNESNGKHSIQLPKHFEKAVKKAIQSEGSSNKQLARKGKNFLEVLKTASRGFPDEGEDSEDFLVRSWVKEGLGVKGSKNSSHRTRMNDSATELYEDDAENEDEVEIMKKDWDADIDWGARLSVRKIRRMQMEEAVFVDKARTRTGAKKKLAKLGDFAYAADPLQQQKQVGRSVPKYDETEAAAYAITRAPMTLGAITNVLNEVHLRLNGGSTDQKVASFSPKTLLDFGSGSVFVGAMAARNVFGDHVGRSRRGEKGYSDDCDDATRNRVAFAAVDKSSHSMVFAKRVEEYMQDEAKKQEEDAKLETKEDDMKVEKEQNEDNDYDDNVLLPIQWSEDTLVPESVRNNLRFPRPEAWSEGSNERSVASLAALQDRSASSFDLVLACYSLGEVMIEAMNEERRIKSGMTSSKHPSGTNKTVGMRKVDLLARQLWDKTADGGVLVIVEPGTPRGSKLVRRIRQLVLDYEERTARNTEKRVNAEPNSVKSKAHVVAPCQHDKKCPMNIANENNNSQMWCHFSQRVERTSMHRLMLARGKGRTYQDEKFSYVAIQKLPRNQAEELVESKAVRILEEEVNITNDDVSASEMFSSEEYSKDNDVGDNNVDDMFERDDEDEETVAFDESTISKARAIAMASQPLWSRVIRPLIKRRGHVVIETCEPTGELEKRTVAKSHGTVFGIGRDGYRRARKTKLGDLFAFEDAKKRTIRVNDGTDFVGDNNSAVLDEEQFIRDWLE